MTILPRKKPIKLKALSEVGDDVFFFLPNWGRELHVNGGVSLQRKGKRHSSIVCKDFFGEEDWILSGNTMVHV